MGLTGVEYKPLSKVSLDGGAPQTPSTAVRSSTAASVEHAVAAWDVPSGEVFYEAVLDRHVPAEVVKAAFMGREFACAHLGVSDMPPMYFFQREGPKSREYRATYGRADWVAFRHGECWGLSSKLRNEIGVRADLSPLQAVEVAAHEVRHLSHPLNKARDEDCESDALAYGVWAAGVLSDRGTLVSGFHKGRGRPFDGAWADIAEQGDALLAYEDDGTAGSYRNVGSKAYPRWVPHHVPCPVDDRTGDGRPGK